MTKSVRVENACTSNYRVKVLVQDLIDSVWTTVDIIGLEYPTNMTNMYIHTTRRLIVEENGHRDD